MNTEEFLTPLSYEQLLYVKERASAMLTAKDQEQKHQLWVVEDREMRLAFFDAGDYLNAIEYLADYAKKHANSYSDPHYRELTIRPIWLRASEARECLEIPPEK